MVEPDTVVRWHRSSTSSSPGAERLRDIPPADLHPHSANANVMDDAVRATLRRNLERERICPPLIVRPLPDLADRYQVLDGHQRLAVLRELGWATAPQVPWREWLGEVVVGSGGVALCDVGLLARGRHYDDRGVRRGPGENMPVRHQLGSASWRHSRS